MWHSLNLLPINKRYNVCYVLCITILYFQNKRKLQSFFKEQQLAFIEMNTVCLHNFVDFCLGFSCPQASLAIIEFELRCAQLLAQAIFYLLLAHSTLFIWSMVFTLLHLPFARLIVVALLHSMPQRKSIFIVSSICLIEHACFLHEMCWQRSVCFDFCSPALQWQKSW